MNDAALVVQQVRFEQKTYWRNPQSAFFTMAFPVMLLVLLGLANKGSHIRELGNITFDQYYVPAILAYGVMGACYTNLAIGLATRRDLGLLKRLRSTPVPAWVMFGGLVGNAIIISVLLSVITIGVGVAFFGVHVPYHPLPLLVSLLLGAVTFCALGTAVSSFAPNADAAPAVVQLPFFFLVFISGTFFPVDPSTFIGKLADYFPLAHFTKATFAPFDPRVHGTGFAGHHLLVMAVWAAVSCVVAVRRFRWEPRKS